MSVAAMPLLAHALRHFLCATLVFLALSGAAPGDRSSPSQSLLSSFSPVLAPLAEARFYYANFRERKNLQFNGARAGPDGCLSLSSKRQDRVSANSAYYEKHLEFAEGSSAPKGFFTTFNLKILHEDVMHEPADEWLEGLGPADDETPADAAAAATKAATDGAGPGAQTHSNSTDGTDVRAPAHARPTVGLRPGEGLAFVVIAADSPRRTGAPGSGLGFTDLGQGFAVEFDLVSSPDRRDPPGAHIAVHWGVTDAVPLSSTHDELSVSAPADLAMHHVPLAEFARMRRRLAREAAVAAAAAQQQAGGAAAAAGAPVPAPSLALLNPEPAAHVPAPTTSKAGMTNATAPAPASGDASEVAALTASVVGLPRLTPRARSRVVDSFSSRTGAQAASGTTTPINVVQVDYHEGVVSVFLNGLTRPLLQARVPSLRGGYLVGFTASADQRSADHYRICDWYFERSSQPIPAVVTAAAANGIEFDTALLPTAVLPKPESADAAAAAADADAAAEVPSSVAAAVELNAAKDATGNGSAAGTSTATAAGGGSGGVASGSGSGSGSGSLGSTATGLGGDDGAPAAASQHQDKCDPGFYGPSCIVDTTDSARMCVLSSSKGCAACVSAAHDCRWCPATRRCIPGAIVGSAAALATRRAMRRPHKMGVEFGIGHLFTAFAELAAEIELADAGLEAGVATGIAQGRMVGPETEPDAETIANFGRHKGKARASSSASAASASGVGAGDSTHGRSRNPATRAHAGAAAGSNEDEIGFSICPDEDSIVVHSEECPLNEDADLMWEFFFGLLLIGFFSTYVAKHYVTKHAHELPYFVSFVTSCVHNACVGALCSICLAVCINNALVEVTRTPQFAYVFGLLYACIAAVVLWSAVVVRRLQRAGADRSAAARAEQIPFFHFEDDDDDDLDHIVAASPSVAAPSFAGLSGSASSSSTLAAAAAAAAGLVPAGATVPLGRMGGRRRVVPPPPGHSISQRELARGGCCSVFGILSFFACMLPTASAVCVGFHRFGVLALPFFLRVPVYMVLAGSLSFSIVFVAIEVGYVSQRVIYRLRSLAQQDQGGTRRGGTPAAAARPAASTAAASSTPGPLSRALKSSETSELPFSHSLNELRFMCFAAAMGGSYFGYTFGSVDSGDLTRSHMDLALQQSNYHRFPVASITGIVTGILTEVLRQREALEAARRHAPKKVIVTAHATRAGTGGQPTPLGGAAALGLVAETDDFEDDPYAMFPAAGRREGALAHFDDHL